MDKDIRDYLKYYIGQEAKMPGHMVIISHSLLADEHAMKHWGIRPILRKLESMTEEEAADVYTIERDTLLHVPTNDFDVRRVNGAWQIVRLDILDTILWVVDDGVIYKVTEDNGKPMIEYTRNMPLIFHYLLSRGFDLFGLIDAGLALDKATIKQ